MSGPFGSSQWMYNAGDYEIANSLRINSDAASGLARFGNDSRNGNTFTISFWAKRNKLGTAQILVTSKLENSGVNSFVMTFTSANKIQVLGQPEDGTTGADSNRTAILTTAVFRDTSAWYHIVYRQDTTQGTASNRHKLYVNGVQQAAGTNNALDQNTEWKYFYNANNYPYAIANDERDNAYADLYMAEHHYTDGVSNGPEAFGETGEYGEWKPIKYDGSHGTYGHYLKLDQTAAGSGTTAVGGHDYVTGTSATIGADSSGNDNHFHIQGYGTHDHMLDSPTNNFCTWNPLQPDLTVAGATRTFSEGNLKILTTGTSGADARVFGTMGMSSGKWYFEWIMTVDAQGVGSAIGVADEDHSDEMAYYGPHGGGTGGKHFDGGSAGYGAAWTVDDIIGVAFNADDSAITFYKNGSGQGEITSAVDGSQTYFPFVWDGSGSPVITGVVNFGQDSSFAGNETAQGNQDGNGIGDFYYEPPSGFLALCTNNLPDAAVTPSDYFTTLLNAGDSSGDESFTTGFQPDWVWAKSRNTESSHEVVDSVRGVTKVLMTDRTDTESTDTESLIAFTSDGFTLGTNSGGWNRDSRTYVYWNWKAGTSFSNDASSTSVGSIDSAGSIDTEAGFSIISYTGTGTAGTVAHGLGATPEMFIVKNRDDTDAWMVYHILTRVDGQTQGAPQTDYIRLDATAVAADLNTVWNDTAPTSSVFSIGTLADVNISGEKYIAYCFRSVDGYCKVGSWTGNANDNAKFVYTGFRPAWVMWKKTSGAENWFVVDTARSTFNPTNLQLWANDDSTEQTSAAGASDLNLLSNGFKPRGAGGAMNGNNETYIYLAFAEQPFKNSNAR